MDRDRIFRVVMLIALVIFFIGYLVNEQTKKTTLEEVIGNLIDEEEKIEEITVYSQPRLVSLGVSAKIIEQELIEEMLEQELKLKEIDTRKLPPIRTTLVIKTNKDSYEVGFDESSIMIGSVRYLADNDWNINPWDMMIVRENLEWETIEYTPFAWE